MFEEEIFLGGEEEACCHFPPPPFIVELFNYDYYDWEQEFV